MVLQLGIVVVVAVVEAAKAAVEGAIEAIQGLPGIIPARPRMQCVHDAYRQEGTQEGNQTIPSKHANQWKYLNTVDDGT